MDSPCCVVRCMFDQSGRDPFWSKRWKEEDQANGTVEGRNGESKSGKLKDKKSVGLSTCCAVPCLLQLRAEEEQQERDRDVEMMAALGQREHESTVRERELKQEARWAGGGHTVVHLFACLYPSCRVCLASRYTESRWRPTTSSCRGTRS